MGGGGLNSDNFFSRHVYVPAESNNNKKSCNVIAEVRTATLTAFSNFTYSFKVACHFFLCSIFRKHFEAVQSIFFTNKLLSIDQRHK